MRVTLEKVSGDVTEAKILGNCLEQKVHYLEREVSKVNSLQMVA